MVFENVTVRVSLFSTAPPSQERRVRKDIRRPRFSFFRFSCQTAKSVTAKTKRPNQDIRPSQRRVIIPTIQPGGCSHQKTKTRLQALFVGSAAVDECVIRPSIHSCQHSDAKKVNRGSVFPDQHGFARSGHARGGRRTPQLSHNAEVPSQICLLVRFLGGLASRNL